MVDLWFPGEPKSPVKPYEAVFFARFMPEGMPVRAWAACLTVPAPLGPESILTPGGRLSLAPLLVPKPAEAVTAVRC